VLQHQVHRKERKYMSDSFPPGKRSALTMLYLQNQDLSGLTPSQLLDKYDDVYDEINNHYKEKRQQKKTSNF
jgi:hypothetical protein